MVEPEPVEDLIEEPERSLDRVRQMGSWFRAFPKKLEAVILQGAEVDVSRQESSLQVPFVAEEGPMPTEEEPPTEDKRPPVVPAVLVSPGPLVVKPKVVIPEKARPIDIERIDWRSFSRRPGSRRGSTIVLNYEESVCNRYARLSAADRRRTGSFRAYLKRNGVHLSEAGIRRLIERTRRNQL